MGKCIVAAQCIRLQSQTVNWIYAINYGSFVKVVLAVSVMYTITY